MTKTIGIIGAGHIGRALATHLSQTNHPVWITNSRGAASLEAWVAATGGSLRAAELQETIENADVLFVAVPWNRLEELAKDFAAFQGKVLVDATNNIVSVNPFQLADTGGATTGSYVASLFPTHHVVKAFNTLAAATLALPPKNSTGTRVIFMSGNDDEAIQTVSRITKDMGFEPIVLGNLTEGSKLQDVGGPLSGIELMQVTK